MILIKNYEAQKYAALQKLFTIEVSHSPNPPPIRCLSGIGLKEQISFLIPKFKLLMIHLKFWSLLSSNTGYSSAYTIPW